MLADEDGQVADAHSISAGLDYPGVGPEHASSATPAARATSPATDDEALAAFHRLAQTEGIIPALESAHALARVADLDGELIVVCLSGRGDKDLADGARLVSGLAARRRGARRGAPRPSRRSSRGRSSGARTAVSISIIVALRAPREWARMSPGGEMNAVETA